MAIGTEILKNIKKHRKQFESELATLKTWAEASEFEKRWFNPRSWPRIPSQEVTETLFSRKVIRKKGYDWIPVGKNVDVSDELEYEYDRAIELWIKAVNPDGYAKRYKGKEYRACSYCHVVVESIKPKTCPFCGRELFYANIPEE